MGTRTTTKLAQESIQGVKESRQTAKLRKNLPRGISIGAYSDGRAKPFWVRYGRPRRLESFPTEVARNDRAQELFAAQVEKGEQATRFNPEEWEEFQRWRAGREVARASLSTRDAVASYLAARVKDNVSADHLRHLRLNLGRFAEYFGAMKLGEVGADGVKLWLGELANKRGFATVTVWHNRKQLNAFFNYAQSEGWVAENPCGDLPAPRVPRNEDVAVLSLRDAFEFFKENRESWAIGRLAVEAFGGLRHSSADRLELGDLDFENRAIVMPASKHKLGRRYYVDGWTRNLWRWLAFAPEGGWQIRPHAYPHEKSHAFSRARLKNPGNVFRHTFATMHLAAFKDAPALAVLLTHRDISMLLTHYRGRGVPQAVGRAYFCITPKTVELSWERFARVFGVPA